MPLTIVSLAYPFVPVGFDTVGGTEQVLALLDDALVRSGHRSIVVACEGSKVSGTLVPTPPIPRAGPIEESQWDWAYSVHRDTLHRVLRDVAVDVIHLHGLKFDFFLPTPAPPALATLHLPPHNYADATWLAPRPGLFVNCVSRFSRNQYPLVAPIAMIPNGVPLDRFRPGPTKEDFVLALGRISPQKGLHLAMDAAKKAGLRLLIGGQVPPFAEDERYFEEAIRPRLDRERLFIGAVPLAQRIDLLARARCLVVPSLIDVNPLVVIEALAAGTPVVASPVGAIPDNIEHGRTGFLVNGVEEMAQAMRRASWLDSRECRRVACERFSAATMTQSYLELYEALAALGRLVAA